MYEILITIIIIIILLLVALFVILYQNPAEQAPAQQQPEIIIQKETNDELDRKKWLVARSLLYRDYPSYAPSSYWYNPYYSFGGGGAPPHPLGGFPPPFPIGGGSPPPPINPAIPTPTIISSGNAVVGTGYVELAGDYKH
jgi:hypothetical protein